MEQSQTISGERTGEPAQESAAWARPLRYERLGIRLFLVRAVAVGGVVEMRSAFLKSRMTDLDVYLRAAWGCGPDAICTRSPMTADGIITTRRYSRSR